MGLSDCSKSLPYWIIVTPVGSSTPRGVGALWPRLCCSLMHLFFLATCVVWDLGHYLLPNGWLSGGRTWLPMQFIQLEIQLQQLFFSCLWSNQLDGGMPASGSSWGMCCWQPWKMVHSTSFCPSIAACQNISCRIMRQWGLSADQPLWCSRNSSTSMACSSFWTSLSSLVDHFFAIWNFSLLLMYHDTINQW